METAKKITEDPKVTDVILFELETPDSTSCFTADPFKVDNVTIFYIERDFLGSNFGEYDSSAQDTDLVDAVATAQAVFCDDPSVDNKKLLDEAMANLSATTQISKFFYKERTPVEIVGTDDFPAWLSTDTTNAYLDLVPEDADGNPQFGHFTYEWHPMGKVREGDYFICWTWTMQPAGSSQSAHIPFKIDGDPRAVTTIPSHVTETDKYEILLERYLPEMYKNIICDGDLTPDTTDKLNQSVAKGFTFLENLANQIIDLFDANALHESMLTYLSNLFDIRLRSSDPTLWRRQIKEAIPTFKKKGTLSGLEDAYAQSGMELNKYTQFWQLTSPYTWEESFAVDSTADTVFELEKDNIELPIDDANFALYIREEGSDTYTSLTKDYVDFEIGTDCIVRMTWIGDQLSNPLTIIKGDILRVRYEYKTVANQTNQDYIISLPLQDQRDEADQVYPPKNWNIRLIDEEDPMFDILIPVRHPFHDPIVFGFIRTEFPYSENIYNMEEYNGSTRPSFDACQIGRDFLDPCSACLSSSFMVDVGIEELNNDRLVEAQDILDEYMPFHAQLHSINFSGEVNEFVQSPTEEIDFLVNMDFTQLILSGKSNPIFNRIADSPFSSLIPDREDLANKITVLSGKLGTGFNDHVSFISPDVNLDSLGIAVFSHILEVLAPSPNAGTYTLGETNSKLDGDPHVMRLGPPGSNGGATEPLNQSLFTFNIWNILFQQSVADITQDDLVKLSDSTVDYASLGVKTQWDVANTPNYTGGAWKVLIPALDATAYEVEDIKNGVLVLDSRDTLPTVDTSSVSYTLLTDLDATAATSTSGFLDVTRRGHVDLKSPVLPLDRDKFILAGDFLHYDGDGIDYEIIEFQDDKLWIDGWTSGDVIGTSIDTRRKLVDKATGLFGYKGLHLTTFSDHEAEFAIINGTNPVPPITDEDRFKENFMFKIGTDFYKIEEWDGINVVLSGKEQDWTTLDAGGTAVAYSIVQFPKTAVNVKFTVFDFLDRNGKDVIIREVFDQVDQNTAIVALSANPGSGMEESVSAEEGISFVIETSNGEFEEGEI